MFMRRKILSMVVAVSLVAALLAGCGSTTPGPNAGKNSLAPADDAGASQGLFPAVPKDQIKVGVIHITDPAEGSGYTYTHDLGIQGMQKNLGLADNQIIRKNNTNDGDPTAIENAILECIEEGCQIIFATSYGYMDTCEKIANEYPDVIISHGTGYKSNGKNFNMDDFFNRGDDEWKLNFNWNDIPDLRKDGGVYSVYDLWQHKTIAKSTAKNVVSNIPSHGVLMVRLTPQN